MERNEFAGFLVYIVMLALAWVVGQTIISMAQEVVAVNNFLVYITICVAGSVVLFVAIYELGRYLGARRGKYQMILFNFFGLCFSKDDGKWKFGFKSPEGLMSETRFVPIKEKANPKKFLWGGIQAYLVSVIAMLALFLIKDVHANIKYFALIYIAVGLILVFYNIIPVPLDILNDGYRIKLLGNSNNIEAYNEFMRIENDILKGNKAKDVKTYENISPMTVLVNMYRYYELLESENYLEAEHLIESMITHSELLDVSTINRLMAQKVFFVIYFKEKEEAKLYYWKTLNDRERKAIATDSYLPSKRVYLLVSGVINESESECRIALNNYKKQISKIKDVTKQAVEKKLFMLAITKVKETLPEANFDELI